MLKKNKKISSLDIEKTLIKNTKSLEDDIINKETIRKIWEVLLKLPEEKRMVFILKTILTILIEKLVKY